MNQVDLGVVKVSTLELLLELVDRMLQLFGEALVRLLVVLSIRCAHREGGKGASYYLKGMDRRTL